jgi:hypothetical protein
LAIRLRDLGDFRQVLLLSLQARLVLAHRKGKDFHTSEIGGFASWITKPAKSSVKFVYGLIINKLD